MSTVGKPIRALLTAIALAMSFTGFAVAGAFDEATVAYERGDLQSASRLMLASAEQGDARAQYALGVMYVQGFGVPQNDAQAMKWFQRAAAQGDARAQYNLGAMYSTRQGGRQTYVAADPWIN
jgi:TPR repeat protein